MQLRCDSAPDDFLMALLFVPCLAWMGFVIQHLWAWFLVPLGVSDVSLSQAAGLRLLSLVLFGGSGIITNDPSSCRSMLKMSVVFGIWLVLGYGAHLVGGW